MERRIHDFAGSSGPNLGIVDAARPVLSDSFDRASRVVERGVQAIGRTRVARRVRKALIPLVKANEHLGHDSAHVQAGSVEVLSQPEMPKKKNGNGGQQASGAKQEKKAAAKADAKLQKDTKHAQKVDHRLLRDERRLQLEQLRHDSSIMQWDFNPQGMGGGSVRKELIDRDGNAVIFGSDYIGPVITTSVSDSKGNNKVGGVLLDYQLNPAQEATLSLQQFSQLYQRFEFLEVIWYFETALDSFKSGALGVLMDADPTDIDGSGVVLIRQAGTTRQGRITPARVSCFWVWHAAKEAGGYYYCTVDPTSSAGIRQTVQSHFVFHVVVPIADTNGPFNGTLGSFRMAYKIRFTHRQIQAYLGGSPFASLSFASSASGIWEGAAAPSELWGNYVNSYSKTGGLAADASGALTINMKPGGYMFAAGMFCKIVPAATTTAVEMGIQAVDGTHVDVFASADTNLLPGASSNWNSGTGAVQGGMTAVAVVVCRTNVNVRVYISFSVLGPTMSASAGPSNFIFSVVPCTVSGVPVFALPTVTETEDRLGRIERLLKKLEDASAVRTPDEAVVKVELERVRPNSAPSSGELSQLRALLDSVAGAPRVATAAPAKGVG